METNSNGDGPVATGRTSHVISETSEAIVDKENGTLELINDKEDRAPELIGDKENGTLELIKDKQDKAPELICDKEDRTTELLDDKKDRTTELIKDKEDSAPKLIDDKEERAPELLDDKKDRVTELINDKVIRALEEIADEENGAMEMMVDTIDQDLSESLDKAVHGVHMSEPNGGGSATDACTSDVSDMKISDSGPETSLDVRKTPVMSSQNSPLSDSSVVVTIEDDFSVICTSEQSSLVSLSGSSRQEVAPKAAQLVTIDLTEETSSQGMNSAEADIIDLTTEPVIDLTADPPTVSETSSARDSDAGKSRRSKRPPMAVYVPPRGRGRGPPGGGAVEPSSAKVAAAVIQPSAEATKQQTGGVDVTDQVSHTRALIWNLQYRKSRALQSKNVLNRVAGPKTALF